MASEQRRVLVVEDEQEMARLVELDLKDLGCEVTVAHHGDRALRLALARKFDLLILDLTLPGTDGIEICRQVRAQTDYPPILMLTARTSEVDRVLGLEVGADDYLTKPFSVRELVARVKAIFRRVDALSESSREEEGERLEVGPVSIDRERREVTIDDEPVSLTPKEFDLLWEFARNPGRVYTRSQLLDRVWGTGHVGFEHTVNSHINRLRNKIEEDPGDPRFVLTVWGVGYKFFDPRRSEEAS